MKISRTSIVGILIGSGIALSLLPYFKSPSKPPDFSFINRGENKSLDLNTMSWLQDIRLAYGIWEGLYTLDPVTLDVIPGAADTIHLSDDQTVYTFHMRPTARWSNGDPVRSTDFVFSWRRMLEHPGEYSYLFYYIKGAEAYSNAFAKDPNTDFSTVGIRAPSPDTLVVTLKHPVTFFTSLCAFPSYFPQNERSMEPFKQVDPVTHLVNYDERFTRPPNLVGNGPYVMTEWSFKRRVRLEANPYYWNAAHILPKIIDQVYSDDPLSAFLRYDDGQVDWLSDLPGDLAAELKARGRKDLHVFSGFSTYFYSINCQPKFNDGRPNPLSDARVRRALAMSLDKRPIVETITRMGEPVADTYIPHGIFPGYTSPPGLPYDVAAARKLLAEAGYPDGKGFPSLTILFNTEGQHSQIAQIVQRQWQVNLNLNFPLESVEVKVFGQRLHDKEYAIARAGWGGDYLDPSTFTDKYLSASDNNDSGWVNPKYDALCNAAAYEKDVPKRLQLLSQAEGLILDEVPLIPVYYPVNIYMFRDNVQGLQMNPRNLVMFNLLKVTR